MADVNSADQVMIANMRSPNQTLDNLITTPADRFKMTPCTSCTTMVPLLTRLLPSPPPWTLLTVHARVTKSRKQTLAAFDKVAAAAATTRAKDLASAAPAHLSRFRTCHKGLSGMTSAEDGVDNAQKTYALAIADGNITMANASGGANVTYTSTVQGSAVTKATALATAQTKFYTDTAKADKAYVYEVAPAEKTRVIERAKADQTYSDKEASAASTKAKDSAAASDTFTTTMAPKAETLAKAQAVAQETHSKAVAVARQTQRKDDATSAETQSKAINDANKTLKDATIDADETRGLAESKNAKALSKSLADNQRSFAEAVSTAEKTFTTLESGFAMARDQAIITAGANRDNANNNDSAALVNDVAAIEDAFVVDVTTQANSLVTSIYSIEKAGVTSLTSAISTYVALWAVVQGTNYAAYVSAQVSAATAKFNTSTQADLDLEEATAHASIGKQQSIHVADSSLKTSTTNADATFLGLVISNLASLDGVIAGLINAFNIVEAAAWKTYTDTAAGAVKNWSHSMADYTETFANARIAAAVAFSHTEATEAKTAGDLIAAANTVWTNTVADADKVYSDAMAVAA